MPYREPVTLAGERTALRHVGPRAAVWPSAPTAGTTVLARSDMVARPLPLSNVPSSPDFVSGSWTGRLDDAGDCQLLFPNREASDGVPWRQRFDPTGHLQFVEVYHDGELDSVCCIDTATPDQQQVQVHAFDGWWMLKKAYERDWITVQAPRDVIDRGTQAWVPATADGFPAGALNAQWTATLASGPVGVGTVTVGASGGVTLTVPTATPPTFITTQIATASSAVPATAAWSSTCSVQSQALNSTSFAILRVTESSGDIYEVDVTPGAAKLSFALSGGGGLNTVGQVQIPPATTYGLLLESDGEWIWGFVNGQFIGGIRRGHATTTSLATALLVDTNQNAASATFTAVYTKALVPFLQRGADHGDYVLPGDQTTYPTGGLHARYYNDADLQSDGNRLVKLHHPSRSQAYAGAGPSEYANQQDATVNAQANPAGAPASNWSCVWFGAIYLKASQGNYSFQVVTPGANGQAVRLWIGHTRLGETGIESWTFTAATNSLNWSPTSSTWAGTLPYGGGTIIRDGWYPIKLEYAVDTPAAAAPQLKFQPPVSYTDPGGTALTGGALIVVPASSLSPLGCVDQRYQGVSHFDLVQQTVQAFAYQASVEPQQLESGLFPGVLAPRVREGHDTDIILEPDRGPRQDGEGILNYSSTLDATDFASSLQGNGAGLQNGAQGQLQAMVYDAPTLLASLFDAQGWQDFSDASFPALLQALLNSQLGLRLAPWQLLSADPTGRPRLAYTWPLPGSIQRMRWRPGDGLRVQARDINVYDTTPRQILVITRNITPNGSAGAQASFANRPRNPARTLKQQLFAVSRWQRNYQRQITTIDSSYADSIVLAAGASTNAAAGMVSLQPGDLVVRARLRIAYISGGPSVNVLVNGADVTTTLNGPWTAAPVNLDLGAVAASDASNRLYVQVKNNSGVSAVTVSYQLLVDVSR